MKPHIPTRDPLNRTFYYLDTFAWSLNDLCHRADTYDADEYIEEAAMDIYYNIDQIADTISFADWNHHLK